MAFPYTVQVVIPVKKQETSSVKIIAFNEASIQFLFEKAAILLISIPPAENGLESLLTSIHPNKKIIEWIGYLSSTGVYGDSSRALGK